MPPRSRAVKRLQSGKEVESSPERLLPLSLNQESEGSEQRELRIPPKNLLFDRSMTLRFYRTCQRLKVFLQRDNCLTSRERSNPSFYAWMVEWCHFGCLWKGLGLPMLTFHGLCSRGLLQRENCSSRRAFSNLTRVEWTFKMVESQVHTSMTTSKSIRTDIY